MAKAAKIEGLDCDASALEGARRVLLTRLREMCERRESALDFADVKGVHDMRVASRRLRSALKDFSPYLRNDVPQKRLKAIAAALGAVRDEDVALAALADLQAQAQQNIAAGLEQLASERLEQRNRARAALQTAISEPVIARFQEKLISRLERATKIADAKKAEARGHSREALSFRQLGREIILDRFAELKKTGDSLYQPLATEPLHRMRIAAKRLRYAMQIFSPCWSESLDSLSKEVAGLQESLGGLHDCDVWIASLGQRLAKHQAGNARAPYETAATYSDERSAAVWLLRHFTKERTTHFRDALARWHAWETTGFPRRLAESLEIAQPSSLAAASNE